MNFVFDVEGFLFPAILPVFFGDEAVDLVQAFRGERVGAEVAGEALDGEFGEFFFGAFGVDDVFVAEFGQAREECGGTVR
jgi:hypothetical protein